MSNGKLILSITRKSDFKFFRKQVDAILRQGYFYQQNLYSGSKKLIGIPKEDIGCIVLWSKDYSGFIEEPGELSKYNLLFQFTITGYSNQIERNVISTKEAIKQLEYLAKTYGSETINWRFDPIAFFPGEAKLKGYDELKQERLATFTQLCKEVSKTGVNRCIISFMDTTYPKVQNRLLSLGVDYYEPTEEEKCQLLQYMVKIAREYGIQLYSCASPFIENIEGIKKASCIDGNIIEKIYRINVSKAKDKGQRKACGCVPSIDLGNYNQICGHNCVYCYANCGLKK